MNIHVTDSALWFALQELLKLGWPLCEIEAPPHYRLRVRGCVDRHVDEVRRIDNRAMVSERFSTSWKKLASLLLNQTNEGIPDRVLREMLEELLGYQTELARFRAALDTVDRLTDSTSRLEAWQVYLVHDLWPEIFVGATDYDALFHTFLQAIADGKIIPFGGSLDLIGWVIETTRARQRVCPKAEESLAAAIDEQIGGLWKSHRDVLLYFYQVAMSRKELCPRRVLVAETARIFCVKESTVRRYLTESRSFLREWLGNSPCTALMPFSMRVAELEGVLRVRVEEENKERW